MDLQKSKEAFCMDEKEVYHVISETYEVTFYDKDEKIDSIQQYRTEEEARTVFNLFNEPDSVDLYSMITLTKTEWIVNARQIFIDALVF